MSSRAQRVVVIPGLDGTDVPVRPFLAGGPARAITYPRDRVLTLDQYADDVAAQLEPDSILVAESFGGSIAVRVTQRIEVAAIVFCNSFVTPALPRALALLPIGMLSRMQVPERVLAWWMLGAWATPERVRALREPMLDVAPEVIASRIRICLTVDERATLARTRMPIVDLRGKKDRLVRPRSHRKGVLAARREATTLDVDAPHAVLLTAPAEVWRAVSDLDG